MRRASFVIPIVVALAACSSTPPRPVAPSPTTAYRTWGNSSPYLPRFVDHSVGEEEVSIQAMGLVGVPYRWGGNTPSGGFDCSGLVQYVLQRAASVELPRTTEGLSTAGVAVSPDDVAPGDLIFFDTDGRPYSHVGIYVGQDRFVNAPSTGGTVRIDYVTNPYWARHFNGIRRVASNNRIPPALPLTPAPTVAPDTALASDTPSIDSVMTSSVSPQPTSSINSPAPSVAVTSTATNTPNDDPIARFANSQ